MPTYEYECKICGERLEVFQSMSDPPLRVCPECGKDLRRIINGGSGIIFKGKGFYITDKGTKETSRRSTGIETGSSSKTTANTPTASSACQSCPNHDAGATKEKAIG